MADHAKLWCYHRMNTPIATPEQALMHGIADVILAVGQPSFPDKLLYLLRSTASFDDYVMLVYHPSAAPVVLQSSFANADHTVWERYVHGAYLLSPFYEHCIRGHRGFAVLKDIAPEDFYTSAYFADYFLPSCLVDEVGFIVQGQDHYSYLLSLGRTRTLDKFSARVQHKLNALEPIIQAAITRDDQLRHAERFHQQTSHAALKARLQAYGADKLTPREQDVMQLLIRGYSSKEAARVLDISPETERVHRKNIYAKLQVDSQKELLSQLFDALLTTSSG